jgi:hypothetical protein
MKELVNQIAQKSEVDGAFFRAHFLGCVELTKLGDEYRSVMKALIECPVCQRLCPGVNELHGHLVMHWPIAHVRDYLDWLENQREDVRREMKQLADSLQESMGLLINKNTPA